MRRWIAALVTGLALLAAGQAQAVIDIAPFVQELGTCKDPSRLRLLKWKMELIREEFPFSEPSALDRLREAYPWVPAEQMVSWLRDPHTPSVLIDGQRLFFSGVVKNIGFRHVALLRRTLRQKGAGSPFFDQLQDIIFAPETRAYPPRAWQPYTNPVTFDGEVTVRIPRPALPESGSVKLWIPLPVQTGSQVNPRLIAAQPAGFVKTVARMDGDFGFIFFDIPVEKLDGDLDCRVQFAFTSYQQRFQVDPDRVMPYDKDSALFRAYTRSYRNTTITPAIAREARQVVGEERNPYRMARKLYEHIVENYPYSLAPHVTLQVLGIHESQYVQEYRHGDCGAQSMLFSAMCRSLGIPARSIGGYQMIMGHAGTHFWAEFYLEGYGWIPVDVTVAEAGDWTGTISEDQRRRYKAFFFANLDPYRYVIQKDVDLPLSPPPAETVLTDSAPPIVVQAPFIECPSCAANPFVMLDAYTRTTITPVYR